MSKEENAVDFVLGALSPGERSVIARTRLYDGALDVAIRELEARCGPLLMPSGEAPVSTSLWARIDAALAEEQEALSGKSIEPFPDGGWFDHGPGIEAKQLWAEKTLLLRCVPGALEGAHTQEEDEHVIVIAGDLVVGGRSFATGDYLFIPAGIRHHAMRSQGGCILFMQYAPRAA